MMRHKRFVPGAAIVAVLTLSACAESADSPGAESGEEAAAYPTEAIEFVTAGDPGGGLDLFARQIQQTLTEGDLLDVQMNITNLGGGGGNPAMEVGRQRSGTADTLIGNSNRVYLNEILGTTDLAVNEDFVPIAQLMTEYVVLAVREDAPYETGPDVVEALAADPRSVTFGVGTVPSDDQLHLLRLAETQDIDPAALNIVAFSSGGDLMTQLLGGQVDAVSTGLSEALPQYEAGEIRILAVTAPERLEGPAADIPTWVEQDVDLVVDHWRGVFGPADMPADAVAYWEDLFAEMVETDAWATVLENNSWSAVYRSSEEFGAILEEEDETAERLLRDVGLIEE